MTGDKKPCYKIVKEILSVVKTIDCARVGSFSIDKQSDGKLFFIQNVKTSEVIEWDVPNIITALDIVRTHNEKEEHGNDS